jgi:hypothetical protein
LPTEPAVSFPSKTGKLTLLVQRHSSKQVTQLLASWSQANLEAREALMPLVYNELRSLAGSYLRRERSDHTLQPTALVHEAYLRLVEQVRCGFYSSYRQY